MRMRGKWAVGKDLSETGSVRRGQPHDENNMENVPGPEMGKSLETQVSSFPSVSKCFWLQLPNISRIDHFSLPPCTTLPPGTQRGQAAGDTEKEEGGLRCCQGPDHAGLLSPERVWLHLKCYGKTYVCRF